MGEMVRIVVAEDEEAIRKNLLRLLRIEGYDPLGAANGQEALVLIRETLPDLVLSDVTMPVMDGHALLQALRNDPQTNSIPFVFLTAKSERGDVRFSMNLGADDYITKPFGRDELLQTIQGRLKRLKLQKASFLRLQSDALRLKHYDLLTCLPNRAWLLEHLNVVMDHGRRSGDWVGGLMVGIDDFGSINSARGRDAGDRLLRDVAGRIDLCIRGNRDAHGLDCVARVSGDEFFVLLVGAGASERLEEVAIAIGQNVAQPFVDGGKEIFVSASIGIAMVTNAENYDGEHLFQYAETAMRQAKAQGPGKRVCYTADLTRLLSRRQFIHNELHHALAGKQLALYYQPQIFLSSGRIAGCEALMRWKHPEVGFISPAEFIPVAEENGFICEMGAWALRAACTQGRLWEKAGLSSRVAVNLSTRQIASGGIVALVVEVLEETGLTPSLLELEITESIAMSDIEYVIETLLALKKLGVTIAMDDFGTGYSSLSYLKRLPLDILKVDQSFIRNLTVDAGDAAITRTVVAMAHSFGMQVVAEGVETIEQRDWLRELGCEVAQGYLYAKPLPADEATVFLRTHLPLPSMMKERAMEIMPESARHGLSHRVF